MAVTYVRNSETGEFELVGPGGATTDTTLSLVGKPADAGAVGSALAAKSDTAHSHEIASLGTLADLGFQYGKAVVECIENTVSTVDVTFDREYATMPIVVVTAGSSAPGTSILEVSVANITYTGFTICMYRTSTTDTTVQWMAAGNIA